MGKPIDETWTLEDFGDEVTEWSGPRRFGVRAESGEGIFSGTEERARLVVAAPEMARMLLNEEWTSQESDEGHLPDQCLRCFGHRNGYVDPGHKPGCEWVSLMKKAGVI